MARGTLTYLNRKGVRELLKSDGVRADLTARAQAVLQEASMHAPVVSGAYRDGLHIEQETTDRVVVRVRGNTNHDWFVEAQYGTLTRALDVAAGDLHAVVLRRRK